MEDTMRSMKDLFGNYTFQTERQLKKPWDVVKYLSVKTGIPEGRIAYKLKGMMEMKTLFHIKSVCDKEVLEGRKTYLHAFNSVLFAPVDNSLHL